MRRRILGIVVALLLAALGTTALVAYVQHAKDDAVTGEADVPVLIVTKEIAQGATLTDIRGSVESQQVPRRLLAEKALTTLDDENKSLVAAVALHPGEQLLSSRLTDPRSLVRVEAPNGLQEVTIKLDPERAAGAAVKPGDTVGVLLSFDPFDPNTQAANPTDSTVPGATKAGAKTPSTTHLTFHKVLVTAVQLSKADSERATQLTDDSTSSADVAPNAATVDEAPSDTLLVTLALDTPSVEQVVFAAEFGHIWLTIEGANASETGGRIVTLDQAYATVPRS
jgi:pilus assembly protein CpaB